MPTGWLDILGLDFRQTYYQAGGIRTRVLESGAGTPLVLLHGTGGHADVYLRNFRRLSRHFRVIAYDLLGHGYTDKPSGPYTPDRYAAHLRDLLDALGIERAHFSGSSLGAWVAAWFAADHPERTRRLVLNAPGNLRSTPEGMALVRESSRQAVQNPTRETIRERLDWVFHRRETLTDELAEIRYRIYAQPGFVEAMENILCLQEPATRARYAYHPDWLGRIQAPALVLWTGHDPLADRESAEQLAGWLPNGRFAVVEDAGHLTQWEAPEEFDAIHIDFLEAAKRERAE